MNSKKLHHAINQSIATSLTFTVCLLAVFGGGLLVFGHFPRMANLEVSELANMEVSQLVGTTTYSDKQASNNNSISEAISSILHLPFSNPLTMLTDQLPETNIQIEQQTSNQSSIVSPITSWAEQSKKIALGWLPSTSTAACITMLQQNQGINVAAPTWIHLSDASGNISEDILPDVVNYAHKHNIKVWAVMDNQVDGNFSPQVAHEVLQNPKARMNMVDELAYQSKVYHLNGINIDFEDIDYSDRNAFTAFIQELHSKLSAENVNLSVDISPDITPLDDDAAFFHAGLADYADEVVLMAYDEHWGSDADPGPVADIPWVEQSVNDLLDTGVPTDKLVLAMPLYTRFWYVHNNGIVTNAAYSVGSVEGILAAHNATGTWNAQLDLMYARYPKPGGYMEVWYPNERSYSDELAIVNDDGLDGIGVWSLDWFDNKTWWSSMINLLTQ
ncbi:glycosyl hydrolase family 18 protein [Alicyclobacillus fastidiosus]|uniref:Glycosyl hydrolase family 18 protein n=1 Tax=Alicyclobacillus fastidiosus TaxID=392011 RepID=A0ABV5ALE7_9BACL|nr:glycosyl hydrolase family 18 protein [Alicyclobacillus fastidiosus]WEH08487.1 glycosyl hydrolase family 18 protein [Alicyclobacillus fastidiosus]